MSIGKYRPGVWSSYTITPGYTGADRKSVV